MKRIIIFLLLSAISARAQEVLTIDQAISTALEQNRTLRASFHTLESSHWGKLNAVTHFLPKVTVDGGLTRIDPESERRANAAVDFIKVFGTMFGIPASALTDIRPFAYRDTYAAGLTVVQPIYNGGLEIVGLRAANATQDRDEFSLLDTEQDVVARVRIGYLNVLKTVELVGLATESVDRTKRHLETTRRREEVGMRTKTDVLRWEVQRASDEGNLISAQNFLAAARLQLNEIMGVDLNAQYSLQKFPGVDSLVAGGLSRPTLYASLDAMPDDDRVDPDVLAAHPALRMMEANLRIADIGIDKEYSAFQPRVNAAFQYNWKMYTGGEADPLRPWAIALTVSFPIFSSFGDYTNLQKARETFKATEQQVETFKRGLQLQATNAQLALRAAKQRLEVGQKGQVEAADVLASVTRRYESGGASNVDLIDVQTAYTAARTNFISAVYDYLIAEVQLARATGNVK
jgi:outer membrane protein TolC